MVKPYHYKPEVCIYCEQRMLVGTWPCDHGYDESLMCSYCGATVSVHCWDSHGEHLEWDEPSVQSRKINARIRQQRKENK